MHSARRFSLPCFCALSLALAGGVFAAPPVKSKPAVASPVVAKQAAPAVTVERGEIEGSLFAIALPAKWTGDLLLVAPAMKEEGEPLSADLDTAALEYRTLLGEGWMVAKTSYRKNGLILGEGVADMNNLRDHIGRTYGKPRRVFVEGEGVGGAIAVLLAEHYPDYHNGALSFCASLSLRDPVKSIGYTLGPKSPVLFVSTLDDLGPGDAYIRQKHPDRIEPVQFQISRIGFMNINQRERLMALRYLITWTEKGPQTLPKPEPQKAFFDATQPPGPRLSLVTPLPDKRGFSTKITSVMPIVGSLELDAQPMDFAAAGISPHSWFEIEINGQAHRCFYYGTHYRNLKRLEWMIFPQAEGYMWLTRLELNASRSTGAKTGDAVIVRRFAGEAEPKEKKPRDPFETKPWD